MFPDINNLPLSEGANEALDSQQSSEEKKTSKKRARDSDAPLSRTKKRAKREQCDINKISLDLWVHIFSYLAPSDFSALMSTCRSFYYKFFVLADRSRVCWLNRHEGRIERLGRSDTAIEQMLQRYGQMINRLSLEGRWRPIYDTFAKQLQLSGTSKSDQSELPFIQLQAVDLTNFPLTESTIQWVKQLSALVSLSIAKVKADDELISEIITTTPNLKSLNASHNSITQQNLEIISEKYKSLEELDLSSCRLTDQHVATLVLILNRNPNLKKLKLSENNFIRIEWLLFEVLRNNQLKSLDFSKQHANEDTGFELPALFPDENEVHEVNIDEFQGFVEDAFQDIAMEDINMEEMLDADVAVGPMEVDPQEVDWEALGNETPNWMPMLDEDDLMGEGALGIQWEMQNLEDMPEMADFDEFMENINQVIQEDMEIIPENSEFTLTKGALTSLNLSGVNVRGEVVTEIILRNPHLEYLNLQGMELSDETVVAIIQNCKNLTSLHISVNHEFSNLRLWEILANKKLESLTLEGAKIESLEANNFAMHGRLKALHLPRCKTRYEHLDTIAKANPNLESFIVSKSLVEGDPSKFKSITALNRLKHLDLSSCFIKEDLLNEVFNNSPYLKSLTVMSCTAGKGDFADAIVKHSGLTSLKIERAGSHHSEWGEESFFAIVKKHKTLKKLYAPYQNLGDDSLKEILRLKNLHTLDLKGNLIFDAGAQQIIDSGIEFKHLDLSDNFLTVTAKHRIKLKWPHAII